MSGPLVTIEANASIEEASQLMVKRRIKKIPVVKDNKLLGILSSSDIVRASPTQLGILEELLKVT
jgi:CBS domain-containing protein